MSLNPTHRAHEGTDQPLNWTGERMLPELADEATFWEHVYRYRFAAPFVRGKVVLDIACGEGYGAYGLVRAGAKHVIGVDLSEEACRHAAAKYGLETRQGDATSIPIDESSIDVLVSFETIEHTSNPQHFVAECARVLKPNGIIIISTPDRDVYSEHGHHNRFHFSELNKSEFCTMLANEFLDLRVYAQNLRSAPWWNVASLSASESAWLNVRGFWRLRRAFLSPSLEKPTSAERHNIASTILKRTNSLSELFNPNVLRRVRRDSKERATYYVVVAKRGV